MKFFSSVDYKIEPISDVVISKRSKHNLWYNYQIVSYNLFSNFENLWDTSEATMKVLLLHVVLLFVLFLVKFFHFICTLFKYVYVTVLKRRFTLNPKLSKPCKIHTLYREKFAMDWHILGQDMLKRGFVKFLVKK